MNNLKIKNKTQRLIAFREENFEWLKEQKKDSGLTFVTLINTLIDHARLKHLDWCDLICEIKDYIKEEN